ncbi:FlgO family outer membrane protein [Bradyrhizobium sp. S69]|uniref:FlgO family outer membrane protein n=1 Tax=Bradyrhizobium sp. S69 TaxID=1641856 RepID=UPI00131C5B09|nr:FlgO family outer membrane protein [Bradyrhizobium sp. S69]
MLQTEMAVPIVKFGVFEVDVRAGELTKLGKRVRLQEQPFQLLAMLLAKPGVLVTREELHLKLWPETTVDFDHGLNKAISKIREALGDSAENPRFIETVARRGYKFLADVTVVGDEQPAPETVDLAPQQNAGLPDLRAAAAPPAIASTDTTFPAATSLAATAPAATPPGRLSRFPTRWFFGGLFVLVVLLLTVIHASRLPSPEIRSVAVLPLENLSTDMSQDYFTDGMTDELITDLAQIRRLRVIAAPSSIANGRSHRSLREIAQDLNVDAVVTGSVLFSSNHVRITARLVKMPSERDVWAQSYERDIQHPLKTQSEIAQSIADELRNILDRQQEDALRKPARGNTVAYGSYLKDRYLWKRSTGDGLKNVLRYFTDRV